MSEEELPPYDHVENVGSYGSDAFWDTFWDTEKGNHYPESTVDPFQKFQQNLQRHTQKLESSVTAVVLETHRNGSCDSPVRRRITSTRGGDSPKNGDDRKKPGTEKREEKFTKIFDDFRKETNETMDDLQEDMHEAIVNLPEEQQEGFIDSLGKKLKIVANALKYLWQKVKDFFTWLANPIISGVKTVVGKLREIFSVFWKKCTGKSATYGHRYTPL